MNNKSKRNLQILAGIGLLIVSLTGCNLTVNNSKFQQDQKTELITYLSEEHSEIEIEAKLKKGFSQLSADAATAVMDIYLHATYSLATQTLLDDETTNALYAVLDSEGTFDLTKIADSQIQKECISLSKQHVVPRFVIGDLFFDVDYGYFADTYGTYLNPDYTKMIEFYEEEKTNDYYNSETAIMNYEIVEQRLIYIYEFMLDYPNSNLKENILDYYNFYKCIYFGAYSQNYVFDSDIKVKDDLYQRYNEFALIVKDNELREFLHNLISWYDRSDFSRTTAIYSKIKEFCGVPLVNTDNSTE